jgi:hypothetical protein
VVDHAKQMKREPGTRPVCAALTASMRKALRLGRTPVGAASKGLRDRRLWGFGVSAATPMGAQWREDLITMERMRRTLETLREKLADGAERSELSDIIEGGLV